MSRAGYAQIKTSSHQPPRDSLELASLASSSPTTSPRSQSSSPSGEASSRKLSLTDDNPPHAANHTADTPRLHTHNRSYSVSSAFDFASNLFPLSTTAGAYSVLGTPTSTRIDLNGAALEKHKSITYLNGLSLIVGLIIGSGIFSSPSQVYTNAGSAGTSLIVWTVAGLLAWTGATSYAELGGAIPLNGGAQAYLSKIFGELAGFLFTWCAVFVLKPGSSAIIAIIFGEYVVRAATGADAEIASGWINKGVAISGLTLVTLMNCISTKFAVKMGDLLMFFKFIALFGITVTGVIVAATGLTAHGKPTTEWKTTNWFQGTSSDPSNWAVALYAGLWAFDGWDNVRTIFITFPPAFLFIADVISQTNYVVGEFVSPHRDLPRVIHTAMPLVILSYLLANVAYIFVLPPDIISSSTTIAVQFGSVVFGPIGSLVLALSVSASCFGALNAATFTSGRLVYAAGQEGLLPEFFGRIGMPGTSSHELGFRSRKRSRAHRFLARLLGDEAGGLGFTPISAMVFNALLCTSYIVIGEFSTLITFYGVAGYTFYFLTVLGLIVLRVREPYLERPYRTWLSTPIIFCCVSLFLLSRAVFKQPVQTLLVVGFVVLGVGVYYWRVRGRGQGNRARDVGRGGRGGGNGDVGAGWKFWRRWGRSSVE